MGLTVVRRWCVAAFAAALMAIGAGACGSSHASHSSSSSSSSASSPATAAPTATAARRAPLRPGARYVALGSSFAAGPGIPAQLGDLCARSDHNYPHLVAARLHLDLTDVTCSGATSANILSAAQGSAPSQIDAVDANTALVTVTIGGNDIDYSTTAFTCEASAESGRSCLPDLDHKHISASVAALPARLDAVLKAVAKRSPHATVVLVTYPKVIPTDASSCTHLGLLPADAAYIGRLGSELESAFRAAAARDHVLLADPYAVGDGHGECAPAAARWIEGAVPESPGFPFHPNANGHVEMATLVERALDRST